MSLSWVRRVPVGSGSREAMVLPLNDEIREFWDRQIQPFIDRYPKPRADKKWRWASKIPKLELVAKHLGQRPEAHALSLRIGTGHFPVGLISMCGVFAFDLQLEGARSPTVFAATALSFWQRNAEYR